MRAGAALKGGRARVYSSCTGIGVWRSPVAHLLWEQGVGGSNPLTPTTSTAASRSGSQYPSTSTERGAS